jgi:SAM-dependent methyltransferase
VVDLLIDRAFWRAYAAVYDMLWDNGLMDAVVAEVVAHVGAVDRVVEVGAGTGLATARLVDHGLAVEAHEPNPAMRARFLRRGVGVPIGDRPIGGIPPLTAAAAVVAVNVLHTTSDPAASLDRLRRIAGPGGRVVVATPEPGVDLRRVARAQRAAGVGRVGIARLVGLHAGLAPLTALAGAGVSSARLRAVTSTPAIRRSSVADVCRVMTFTGG